MTVVVVLVGHKDRLDIFQRPVDLVHQILNSLPAQPGINQDPVMGGFQIGHVPSASTGQNTVSQKILFTHVRLLSLFS